MKGFPTRDAPDLVETRGHIEGVQFRIIQLPHLQRFRLTHLAKSRNEGLQLIPCVSLEEGVGEDGQDKIFRAVVFVFVERCG